MRAGMFDGRGGVDAGPAGELEGPGRDIVVTGASGLLSVSGAEGLWTGPINRVVCVM